MTDFSWTRFKRVQNLSIQRQNPHRTVLRPPVSNIERFESKEFRRGDVAELFHENTKLSPSVLRRVRQTATELSDSDLQYMQAALPPDYRQVPTIELPDTSLSCGLEAALERRRSVRKFRDKPLQLTDLSALLQHGCGVSKRQSIAYEPGKETEKTFRTYPSPGALYPTEVYVCAVSVDGLEPGVYYYSVDSHGLKRLESGGDTFGADVMDRFELSDPSLADAPVVFALTTAFWRAKSKYGPRAYRYAMQETGHVGQNVLLVAAARAIGALPLASFRDDDFNELLGVDGVNEAITYALAAGYPKKWADSPNER